MVFVNVTLYLFKSLKIFRNKMLLCPEVAFNGYIGFDGCHKPFPSHVLTKLWGKNAAPFGSCNGRGLLRR